VLLFAAVIDRSGDFSLEPESFDDAIDVAVFE
jgi:hypothetical protein